MSEFEEVDAYGRTIPGGRMSGGLMSSRNNGSDGGRPSFPPRMRQEGPMRGRSRSPLPFPNRKGDFRHHPRSNPPPRLPIEHPDQDRYFDGEFAQQSAQRPISLLPPVATYKNFIITQDDNLPPEVYQKLYGQYQRDYLEDFSNKFFDVSMSEEWFQDRYNPINIMAIEKETAEWAAKEALAIKTVMENDLTSFVSSCSLDPRTGMEGPNEGRQFVGYSDRTLYITQVHACCPRSLFKQAVVTALSAIQNPGDQAVDPSLLPERVVVSHPSWSVRSIDRFERNGWVIFKTVEGAQRGMEILKNLEIKVPGPVDAKGEPIVAFSFTIQATVHSPRSSANPLPDFFSSSSRLNGDLIRAQKLAGLLDEQRSVPADVRLKAILSSPAVCEATNTVAKRLDVCLAYLRRVHFVSFYQGRRFRDEAHLLSMASLPVFRGKPAEEVSIDDDHAGDGEAMEKEEATQEEAAEEREEGGRPTYSRDRIEHLVQSVAMQSHQDAEDAAALQEMQEKDFSALVHDKCSFEPDGKCRCCFDYCRKLFKAYDFLAKHLRVKHPEFGLNIMLKHSEAFMRKRYLAEPVVARPLPPVEVETAYGRVEYRSVAEVVLKASQPQQMPSTRPRNGGDRGDRHFNDRRQVDRRFERGGPRDRERPDRDREAPRPVRDFEPVVATVSTEPTQSGEKRKMASYLDVDVPKESVVSVDYGVALAAPVKRRRVVATSSAPAASASAAQATPAAETSST